MTLPACDPFSYTLEAAVAAFESALQRGDPADLEKFLPDAGHPRRDAILCELIRVDMEYGWQAHRPRALIDYETLFPDLFANRERLEELAFEEYRLRCQAGEKPTPLQYQQKYGIDTSHWPAPISEDEGAAHEVSGLMEAAALIYQQFNESNREAEADSIDMLQAHSVTRRTPVQVFEDWHRHSPELAQRMADGLTQMPEEGNVFLGFTLQSELGRGAFGRVFLARQEALANRQVVLKIAPDVGGESRALAQMQHTHIVPIYSVHNAGPFQAVCMPFLGTTTLADIKRDLSNKGSVPQTGLELLSSLQNRASTIKDRPSTHPSPPPGDGPPHPSPSLGDGPLEVSVIANKLQRMTYVEAVLWLGSCLADGLAHAHERGILHRDLKPANVLITDEGQPLLLDFNLSADTKLTASASAAMVGGTLPYMAPEHLEAFSGKPRLVDARADIYSLGIILFELLTGRSPFRQPFLLQAAHNRNMGEVIKDMLHERTAAAPSPRDHNRSVSPAAAAIVRRCLEPEPNKRYATARQLQEDLERQLNALPLQHTPEPSLRERVHKYLRRSPRLPAKIAAVSAVLLLALAVWFGWQWHHLHQQNIAEENLSLFRQDLHKIHFALNTSEDWQEQQRGLQFCREALDRYGILHEPNWHRQAAIAYLPEADQDRLKKELGSLLLLFVRASMRQSPQEAPPEELWQQCLSLNEKAEVCLAHGNASPVVLQQRAELLKQLGRLEEAEQLRQQAGHLTLQTAQDLYIQAQELTSAKKFREALPLLLKATAREPQDYWARFLLGICYDGLGNDREAATAYTVCIALDPEFHGAYFNRGLAYLRQKDHARAIADFDHLIQHQKELVNSHVNRGLARQARKEFDMALADFNKALELGADSRVLFMRARVRFFLKDKEGYEQDMAEGLGRRPEGEKGWIARGLARAKKEPEKALADFDEALKHNPYSRPAWNNKAYVLAAYLKQPAEAVKMLDKVIEHYPDYVPARGGRGVLHARLGNWEAAWQDARDTLDLDRKPAMLYQVGCIYALTSKEKAEDSARALKLLSDALRQGYGADLMATDSDLDPLRPLPEFRRLLAVAAELRKSG